MTNICRSCGKQIFWFRKKNGAIHRPLDFKDSGLYVIDGIVQDESMKIYIEHYCKSEDVEKFQDETVKNRIFQEEYEQQRDEARRLALKKPCPRAGCEAKINEACINLTKKKQGNIVKTVWPHEQRMK